MNATGNTSSGGPSGSICGFWRVHFRRLGWVVRFAENDSSEDPTAKSVMRAIGDAQASEYRRQIKANAKRGAREKTSGHQSGLMAATGSSRAARVAG